MIWLDPSLRSRIHFARRADECLRPGAHSNLIAANGGGFSYDGGRKTGTLFISNNKFFLNSGNDVVSPDAWTVVSSAMNNYISQPDQKFTVT